VGNILEDVFMRKILFVLLAVVCSSSVARAQAAAKPVQLALDFGLVNAAGNTNVTTFNLGQKLSYTAGAWVFAQTAKAIYGETEGAATAESYDASIRADRVLSPSLSLFGLGTYQRNPFAGIASRWGEGGGLAFRAVRAPRDSLTLEGSLAANQERSVAGVENGFTSARGALAFKHLFGTAAFFTQGLEWITDLGNSDDQRLNSETAFTAPLSRQVALKAAYVIKYDKLPEPGFETTDRILTTGVQIVF
jgi:putative salt-induced outer membrane protein YdiY